MSGFVGFGSAYIIMGLARVVSIPTGIPNFLSVFRGRLSRAIPSGLHVVPNPTDLELPHGGVYISPTLSSVIPRSLLGLP